MGTQERSEVVEGTECDWVGPSSVQNERVNETSAPCRDRGPGGHMGELVTSRGVESDWRRWKGAQGVGYARRRGSKDGATSGASHDSKRVGTRLLAGDRPGQHGKRKGANTDVPGPSIPPPSHPRRPTESVDPPRRRGRMKSPPRRIRRSKRRRSTY